MPEDTLIQLAGVSTPRIIKVIGVGGGGGNAVAQMYRDNIPEVRYLVANTDSKALEDNPVPDHLQMGPGLGAGGRPELGCRYAKESIDQIVKQLDDETKMVFVTAGMGGGTGTGASPIIAHEARKKGILTIGIVTIPFLFEGKRQIDKALDGMDMLAEEVDAMLVINNERLREVYDNLDMINAFRLADKTLSTAVSSITEIITTHGKVGLDFQDVKTTLTDGGVAVMSTAEAEGEHRVTRAIEQAINSPLLNNNDIYNATHILLSITTSDENGKTLLTSELDEVTEFMQRFNEDIQTKWGLAIDPSLGDKIKITIIASGFKLYYTRKREVAKTEEEPEDKVARRGLFYKDEARKIRRRPKIYLFTESDLANLEVIEQVESVATSKRTIEQLEKIRSLSDTNK